MMQEVCVHLLLASDLGCHSLWEMGEDKACYGLAGSSPVWQSGEEILLFSALSIPRRWGFDCYRRPRIEKKMFVQTLNASCDSAPPAKPVEPAVLLVWGGQEISYDQSMRKPVCSPYSHQLLTGEHSPVCT